MIEQQLVLVLNVCKTRHLHIKIRETCHANMLNLHATLTKVSSLEICGISMPEIETTQLVICYYQVINVFYISGATAQAKVDLWFSKACRMLVNISPARSTYPFSSNKRENIK